jgi:predicted ATP-grasp superfamily ATP-dependent carboligase
MKVRALVVADSRLFGQMVTSSLGVSNIETVVLCTHSCLPYTLSRYCCRNIRFPQTWVYDYQDKLIQRINTLCREHAIDVVVPADLQVMRALTPYKNLISEAHLFPLADLESMRVVDDKWLFAKLCKSLNVPHPQTKLIENFDDIKKINFSGQIIVKPCVGNSSRGVYALPSIAELEEHLNSDRQCNQLPQIVQDFIVGFDMDVTVLAEKGVIMAWTIQERISVHERRFVVDDRILKMAAELISELNYSGIVDFDIRYDTINDTPLMMEGNPRFPGSLMFKLWAGVNFPFIGCQLALGIKNNISFKPIAGYCAKTGFSLKSLFGCFLRGKIMPDNLGPATQECWMYHLRDPLPHLLNKLMNIPLRLSRRKIGPRFHKPTIIEATHNKK